MSTHDGSAATGQQAVLYAAKSTEDKHGSIPTQLADGRKLAQAKGLEVVAEFQDEAASAYHGDRGPGLAAAMAACEGLSAEHGGSALIVQHSDRLARGDAKQARHLIEVVLWAIKSDVQLLSVQDPEMLAGGDMALLLGAIGGMRNHQDSKRKGLAVKDGMRRAALRGQHTGTPPFGYRRVGHGPDRRLVVDPAQAEVVKRIFRLYVSGEGQRAITITLNAEGTRPARGGRWVNSAVARLLSNVVYTGRIKATGEGGEPLPGQHEAIIDRELFDRTQEIRVGRLKRKPGRHPEGGHLLVGGIFRCSRCGSAMKPMRPRPSAPAAYVCSGREQHGSDFCDLPRLRRERVDEPFLAALLDSFIDLDATKQRIAEQTTAALGLACEAVAEADDELLKAEQRIARIRRDYQDGDLDAAEFKTQKAELEPQRDGASEALRQAQARVEALGQSKAGADAEKALLAHLASVKAAVAAGASNAPSLAALRHTIAALFTSVQLIEDGDLGPVNGSVVMSEEDGETCIELRGSENGTGRLDTTARLSGDGSLALLPIVRDLSLDDELEVVRAELPAPVAVGAKA